MPPSGRASGRPQRSVALWAVAAGLVTALVVAGCAGSVVADESSLLASAAATASPTIEPDAPLAEAKAAASPDATLLTTTPDPTARVGLLAPDFPSDLLPMPSDAMLLVTSAVPVGTAGVQEVSLNLQTSWPTTRILDLYRTSLVAAGFTEVPAVDTGLSAESTFTRSGGNEIISVGVLDGAGVRTVTIGGRVHAKG